MDFVWIRLHQGMHGNDPSVIEDVISHEHRVTVCGVVVTALDPEVYGSPVGEHHPVLVCDRWARLENNLHHYT